jgi:CBS-domain-containing membrane protein
VKTPPTVVRDLMSADVVTLGRNEKLVAAEDLMRLGRIRHLPVVDEEGVLAGIVSQRDLFHSGLMKALGYGSHAQQHALATVAIKEAMTTDVVTTTPDTPVHETQVFPILLFLSRHTCTLALHW